MRFLIGLALLASLVLVAPAAADPSPTRAPGRVAVTYDDSRRTDESFGALAAAPDGTVFAAGGGGRARRLAITSFAPDGSLVRSFGDGGGVRVPVDVRGGDALLRAADGTLVALGQLPSDDGSTQGQPAAVRVSAAGAVDRGYGGDGIAEVPGFLQGGCTGCGSAALTADGGLVVVGLGGRLPNFRFRVARLRPDGSPDAAFGAGGVADPFAEPGGATGVVVQPGGRIVVLGFRGPSEDPESQRPVLAGLRADGSLDPSFGRNGVVEVAGGGFQLAQDGAGRLLVATAGRDVAVLRFTPDGAPDTSFGVGGRVAVDVAGVARALPTADGVVVADAFAGRLTQVRLDSAGRIVARHARRLPFGGGSFLPNRLSPLGRQSFVGQTVVARPDGSLAVGGLVSITHEGDGGTVSHFEAGLALVGADGRFAATRRASGAPRLRVSVRRESLRTIRRRRAVALRLDPGRRRGLARVVIRARGRTVARGMVPFWTARRVTARVRLTPAGRRLTASASRLRMRVTVIRNDMVGNRRTRVVRATTE